MCSSRNAAPRSAGRRGQQGPRLSDVLPAQIRPRSEMDRVGAQSLVYVCVRVHGCSRSLAAMADHTRGLLRGGRAGVLGRLAHFYEEHHLLRRPPPQRGPVEHGEHRAEHELARGRRRGLELRQQFAGLRRRPGASQRAEHLGASAGPQLIGEPRNSGAAWSQPGNDPAGVVGSRGARLHP